MSSLLAGSSQTPSKSPGFAVVSPRHHHTSVHNRYNIVNYSLMSEVWSLYDSMMFEICRILIGWMLGYSINIGSMHNRLQTGIYNTCDICCYAWSYRATDGLPITSMKHFSLRTICYITYHSAYLCNSIIKGMCGASIFYFLQNWISVPALLEFAGMIFFHLIRWGPNIYYSNNYRWLNLTVRFRNKHLNRKLTIVQVQLMYRASPIRSLNFILCPDVYSCNRRWEI